MSISSAACKVLLLGTVLWVSPVLAQDATAKATALLKAGEDDLKRGDLHKAEDQLLHAARLGPNNPQTYNFLGFICDQTGRTDKALQYYRTALRLNSGFTPARNNLGTAYLRQGRTDLAIDQFLQTLKARPNDLTANYNLGLIYADRREYSRAVNYLDRARSVAPDDPAVQFNVARTYFASGRNEEGLKVALTTTGSQDEDLERFFRVGIFLLQNHQFEPARQCFEKADRSAPNHPEILLSLAETNLLSADYAGALASIDRFIVAFHEGAQETESASAYLEVARKLLSKLKEKTPASFHTDYALGEVLFLEKKYDEALKVLGEQAENGKSTPEYFNLLGMSYAGLNQFPEAAHAVEKAVALSDGQSRYYFNLAGVYQKAGDNLSAIKILERALARDPSSPETFFSLGLSRFNLGNYSGAIDSFEKALQRKPDFDQAQLFLGRSYEKLGKRSEAISAYRTAISARPSYYPAYFRLAVLLLHSGHGGEAVPLLQEVVRLNPVHADAHYELGTIYAQQGRTAEAISQLEKAISINRSHESAHYQLGRLYAKMGNRAKADEMFSFVSAQRRKKLEAYQKKLSEPN